VAIARPDSGTRRLAGGGYDPGRHQFHLWAFLANGSGGWHDLSLSSTAIVLKLSREGLTKTEGRSSFSVLLFQDIAVIPMLALLPLLAVGLVRDSSCQSVISLPPSNTAQLPGWQQACW